MTKLVETTIDELAKCLYETNPISMEVDGVWRKVRFFELSPDHRQVLYDQASAAIVFMGKFDSMLEAAAKAAVNERLDELIAVQSGAGQNAESSAQI